MTAASQPRSLHNTTSTASFRKTPQTTRNINKRHRHRYVPSSLSSPSRQRPPLFNNHTQAPRSNAAAKSTIIAKPSLSPGSGSPGPGAPEAASRGSPAQGLGAGKHTRSSSSSTMRRNGTNSAAFSDGILGDGLFACFLTICNAEVQS